MEFLLTKYLLFGYKHRKILSQALLDDDMAENRATTLHDGSPEATWPGSGCGFLHQSDSEQKLHAYHTSYFPLTHLPFLSCDTSVHPAISSAAGFEQESRQAQV